MGFGEKEGKRKPFKQLIDYLAKKLCEEIDKEALELVKQMVEEDKR